VVRSGDRRFAGLRVKLDDDLLDGDAHARRRSTGSSSTAVG
jgi:hypothetical protein